MKYIKLLRVKHYVKNLLIFFPLIFGGEIFKGNKLIYSLIGFLIFSLMSSVVYIINDIQDVEKDRQHEIKKNRPIASGQVSVKQAVFIAGFIGCLCIVANCIIWKSNLYALGILLAYFVINIIYSVAGGKRIPLLDVALLVTGFVLRVQYGAVISSITVSGWLYLVIIAGAFFMGFGKRRNELMKNSDSTREVLKYYNQNFLDKSMYSCQTLAIVFYALWCLDRNSIGESNFLITVPLLMLVLFKYSLDIENITDSYGDPVEVILNDKILVILTLALALVLMILLYK